MQLKKIESEEKDSPQFSELFSPTDFRYSVS